VSDLDDELWDDDEFEDDDSDDNAGDDGAVSADASLSVREFIAHVNHTLKARFRGGVWVHGEVSRWRVVGNNAYCQLVETDGRNTVGAVELSFFNNNLRRVLSTLKQHRVSMDDGVKVRICGTPDIWDKSGKFSMVVSDIDPRFTLGDMAASRDALVAKLKAAGLYDENRLRTMAELPLRVGIITSVGTAAWHDIMDRFEKSGLGFQLKIANVRVQGNEAVPGLVDAIWSLGMRNDLDVLMIVRGGGSRTDLACFDAEEIANAIAQCPLPVITGIGHEIDRSIADEVAFAAYTTPTACAAWLVDTVKELVGTTEATWSSIEKLAGSQLALAESRLLERGSLIRTRAVTAVERANTNLALVAQRLVSKPAVLLDSAQQKLDGLDGRVRLLDPVNTMARGWSITRNAAGVTLRSTADARPGDQIITTLRDGTVASTVTGSQEGEPNG
jgi:exodeoxyribonuclease VII large subunit